MWNSGLQPRLFSGCLREPRPNCGNVQETKVLEEDAPTEAKTLNNEVVKKVVGRCRNIGGQDGRNINRVIDNLRYNPDNAGRNRRENNKFDEEESEIEVLGDDFPLTARRGTNKHRQLSC